MTWATVWGLARRVPPAAWLVLVLGLGLAAAAWRVERRVQAAQALGRAEATTALLARVEEREAVWAERLRVAQARTDTVLDTVTVRVRRVDTLLRRIPDTVLVQLPPVVREVVTECAALALECGKVRALLVAERAARDSVLHVEGLRRVALQDSVQTLRRRPSRLRHYTTVVGVGLLGVWAGGR
jgi:hypothetical protein